MALPVYPLRHKLSRGPHKGWYQNKLINKLIYITYKIHLVVKVSVRSLFNNIEKRQMTDMRQKEAFKRKPFNYKKKEIHLKSHTMI